MEVLYRQACALALLATALFFPTAAAGHWDMDARFWQDDVKERFNLRIHNGTHANREPVRRELDICFWVEKEKDRSYMPVSERKCTANVLRPDEWLNLSFNMGEVRFDEGCRPGGKLSSGKYRAVMTAREKKGIIARLIFGAALERLYTYFEVR